MGFSITLKLLNIILISGLQQVLFFLLQKAEEGFHRSQCPYGIYDHLTFLYLLYVHVIKCKGFIIVMNVGRQL